MLESMTIMAVIGVLLGFLSGIGVGGGSLLMMWLTLVVKIEHPVARIINLLSFLPAALIASIFRWRQGSLNIRKVIPAIIAGCISAAVFSVVSGYLDLSLLKKLFGGLLIFTGLRELFYRPRNAR